MQQKPKVVLLESEKKPVDDISISASSDRTVYPLDSIIHVRANLSTVVKGEMIIYEIFNSERELLLSQTLDPSTYDDPCLVGSNIFQISFRMKENKWEVGSEYIVRATHSSSYAEDSFLIDQRTPVVQSDKSIYRPGSDMILTVIDPDADKDSSSVDYVGNRINSLLTIESPYGKIEGYELRETGNSTGIFQGIIGILEIKKDGSISPQNFNEKIIDKIQGSSITDGFIGGSPGDELTVTYKNNTDEVKLVFFISNFNKDAD